MRGLIFLEVKSEAALVKRLKTISTKVNSLANQCNSNKSNNEVDKPKINLILFNYSFEHK